MKKNLLLTFLFTFLMIGAQAQIIVTGAFDGPLPGGNPKGVEIYVTADIADMSIFGLGSANNGLGTDGIEYNFPAVSASMGDFIYVTNDSLKFIEFFEFSTPYVSSDAMGINGDDAIEVFMNEAVIDVFGDIDTDGSGEAWEYLDGWAYRNDGVTTNGGVFVTGTFFYSGINMFDDQSTNSTSPTPFPLGTYVPTGAVSLNLVDDVINMESDELSVIINSIYANDFIDGTATSADFPSPPNEGVLSVVGNDLVYTKTDEDFCGEDSFTYSVCIGADCDTALVEIFINCPISFPDYSIADVTITDADGVADSVGVDCRLTGIVYGVNQRPSGLQFTIIDSDNNGIGVFNNSGDLGYTITEGDEITISGTIGQYNGLTQIYPAEISLISVNNSLVTPMIVGVALTDDIESSLIHLENVEVTAYNSGGSGDNYDINYDGGTTTMRIDNDVEGYGSNVDDAFVVSVSGICGQYDNASPYDEGYQIFPRYLSDIAFLSSVVNLATQWGIKATPSLFTTELNITTLVDLDAIKIVSLTGQVVFEQNNITSDLKINTNNFTAGFYIVLAEKDGQVGAIKVMKQ